MCDRVMMRYGLLLCAAIGSAAGVGEADQGERLKLTPPAGAQTFQFATNVAIDDGVAVAGSPIDGVAGAAYVFDVETGALMCRLAPLDGAEGDAFGSRVGVSGSIAIVGAPFADDDVAGSNAGAAYLFDVESGAQLAKLVPDVQAAGDRFGSAVAIDGDIAVIGAPFADVPGADAGRAFTFSVATGQQIETLRADDLAGGDQFGFAVDISGRRAIIGSPFEDDAGTDAGAAYVFDAASAAQIAKLVAADGSGDDRFGLTVGISGATTVVGAPLDDPAGDASGAAYVHDATTAAQRFKLTPDGLSLSDGFGQSVAIDDGLITAGAPGDDDNGSNAGAAYLFLAATGQELCRIEATDADSFDAFGSWVAVGDDQPIVSARGANAAYLFGPDTDGDGLFDIWETDGVDANGDGVIDLDLAARGADPMRKDLFVEADAMVGRAPDATVAPRVIAAFANAPVPNPDGSTGIDLHLVIDDTDIPLAPFPNAFDDFDDHKLVWFGTAAEVIDPNWDNIRNAKLLAYRYCIFGESYSGTSSSGLSEYPGDDFMVTLGTWSTPGGTPDQQAGAFMHEFGHALGLNHGGGDGVNYKPNYYSVMNYLWQNPNSNFPNFWRLDYSSVALAPLDEGALLEPVGIDGSDPDLAMIRVLINTAGAGAITNRWVRANGAPVDFNDDGAIANEAMQRDLNYLLASEGPSPGQELAGHDDWENIRYRVRGPINFEAGAHERTTADEEMTLEIFNALGELPPPPPLCAADLTGDGAVGDADLGVLLGDWGDASTPSDLTGDGVVDGADLGVLLGEWGACE